MFSKKHISMVVAGASVALVLACKATREPVQSTQPVFTIGAVLPLTGDAAQWGVPARKGAQLAVDEINAAGGIRGQSIALAAEDDRCDAKEGVAAFNKLATAQRAPVVLGAVCSSVTLAVAPIANREHIVLISPASTNPKITDAGDYVFRNIPSDDLRGRVFADYLFSDVGLRKVAMLYINNEGGVGNKDSFAGRFKALGGTISGEEAYQQGATDVRTQLTKIKGGGAQAILVVSYPADTILVLKQSKELALTKPLYFQTEAVEDPSVLREAGAAANGVTYILPAPAEGAAATRFANSYQLKYGTAPELFAAEAYDIVYMIKEAIAAAKAPNGPTSDQVRNYLYSVLDRAGASGTITFDRNGDVTKPMAIKTVTAGQPKIVTVKGSGGAVDRVERRVD